MPRKIESQRQNPSRPSCCELAAEDERPADLREVDAGLLLDPVHEHAERIADAVGQVDLTPRFHRLYDASRVRRTAFATLATTVVALATATVAYAGNGGFLPGEAHSPNAHRIDDAFIFVAIFTGIIFLLVEGALIAFIIKYRRGKRPRDARKARRSTARRGSRSSGRCCRCVILAVIGVVRLLQAAGDLRRAEGGGRRPDDDHGRGSSVLLAVPLSERRRLDRHDGGPGRPGRERGRQGLRLRRQPLLVGARPRRQVRRDPGHDEPHLVQGAAGELRRPLRRALRHPARADGRDGEGRAARAVRRVHQRSASPTRPGRRSARKSGRACARSATGSITSTSARRSAATRCSPTGRASRRCFATGRGQMPAVGKNWTGAQLDALISWTKQYAKAGAK